MRVTIIKKIRLTPTTLMIRLKFSGRNKVMFRAGQHVILRIPMGEDGMIAERPFSIASPPKESRHIDIFAKLIEGGVASRFLEHALEGTSITIYGPLGNFHILSVKRPLCFIASGTGVSPFRSMIHDLLEARMVKVPMHLALIVASKKEIFLEKELKDLSNEHSNFTYELVVASFFDLSNMAPNSATDFYLCGGAHFVNDMKGLLMKRGFSLKRIHFEEFK